MVTVSLCAITIKLQDSRMLSVAFLVTFNVDSCIDMEYGAWEYIAVLLNR